MKEIDFLKKLYIIVRESKGSGTIFNNIDLRIDELEKEDSTTIQFKIDYMLDKGFNLHKCSYRNICTLEYKEYEWTFDEINGSSLSEIMEAIKGYDLEEVS